MKIQTIFVVAAAMLLLWILLQAMMSGAGSSNSAAGRNQLKVVVDGIADEARVLEMLRSREIQKPATPGCLPFTFEDRKRIAASEENKLRMFGVSTIGCMRCGLSAALHEQHSTWYRDPANDRHEPSGAAALCVWCYEELKTPSARWPYYQRLFDQYWKPYGYGDKKQIEAIRKALFEEPCAAPVVGK